MTGHKGSRKRAQGRRGRFENDGQCRFNGSRKQARLLIQTAADL